MLDVNSAETASISFSLYSAAPWWEKAGGRGVRGCRGPPVNLEKGTNTSS